MLRYMVLNLATSLAVQELKEGNVSYKDAIDNAINEVCVRMNVTRKELVKKVRTSCEN